MKFKEYIEMLLEPVKMEKVVIYETLDRKLIHSFHRTRSINKETLSNFIQNNKSNTRHLYGNGLYSTYTIDSQLNDSMVDEYGSYIIKFVTRLTTKFLLLDKVYGNTLDDIKNVLSFIPDKELVEIIERISSAWNKNQYTSSIALDIIEKYYSKLDGILFTGANDGNVIVSYNVNLTTPISVAECDRGCRNPRFKKLDIGFNNLHNNISRSEDDAKIIIKQIKKLGIKYIKAWSKNISDFFKYDNERIKYVNSNERLDTMKFYKEVFSDKLKYNLTNFKLLPYSDKLLALEIFKTEFEFGISNKYYILIDEFEMFDRFSVIEKFKESYSNRILKNTASIVHLLNDPIKYFKMFRNEYKSIFKNDISELQNISIDILPVVVKMFKESIMSFYNDNKELMDVYIADEEFLSNLLKLLEVK